MTESAGQATPYKVVYSGLVLATLRNFIARARAAGQNDRFAVVLEPRAALPRVYPQFGEPLFDLQQEQGRIFTTVLCPLFVVRYAVVEETKVVFVGSPPKLMPHAGF